MRYAVVTVAALSLCAVKCREVFESSVDVDFAATLDVSTFESPLLSGRNNRGEKRLTVFAYLGVHFSSVSSLLEVGRVSL